MAHKEEYALMYVLHDEATNRVYTSSNDDASNCDDIDVGNGQKEHVLRAAGAYMKRIFTKVTGVLHSPAGILQTRTANLTDETEANDLISSDFITVCKKASERASAVAGEVFRGHKEEEKVLRKADNIIQQRKVTINLFAQCNTGKSTLLNSMLGDKFLPVSVTSETTVMVTIQHNNKAIHKGPCEDKCPQCPILEIKSHLDGSVTTVYGADNIHERILKENRSLRQKANETITPPELILKVNIPLLAENIPEGWTVVLVDNPGIGEMNETVAEIIRETWDSSMAHIYLTTPETKGLQPEIALLKAFAAKGLLSSNSKFDHHHSPLVIALNKIDAVYTAESENVTVKELCEEISASVLECAPGACLPVKCILPISAKWAWLSCQLKKGHTLSPRDYYKVKKSAQFEVLCMPTLAWGQGRQTMEMNQMTEEELGDMLYDSSGLHLLVRRVSTMVSNDCIQIWAKSLCAMYKSCLAKCSAFFLEKSTKLHQEARKRDVKCKEMKEKLASIANLKSDLEQSIQWSTRLKLELEECFEADIKDSKIVQLGNEYCEYWLGEFEKQCKLRIGHRTLSPKTFERDLEEFLGQMETRLQDFFNNSCSFRLLYEKVQCYTECVLKSFGKLETLGAQMCSDPLSTLAVDENKRESFFTSQEVNPPNLGDMRVTVEIPNVDFSFIERLIESLKSLWLRLTSGSEAATGQDRIMETPERDMPYRRWNEDLDRAIKEVKTNLQEVCTRYFPSIKDKAVEYFHGEYTTKISAHLCAFNAKYEKSLNEIQKENNDLEDAVTELKKEYSTAMKYIHHFEALRAHLDNSCDQFVRSLPQHSCSS